ncbi:AraC family transcriptional regulator [Rhodospirillaceae bacterium SYSU D60014]|uniref:AraC family transcriptional regulator n=1 Tax=Virgifigura deserti TaxID=2268457 RepID=UPI000E664AF7
MMDVISDMLRAMRLTGGVFLDAEFTAPWCVTAQVGPEDCAPFMSQPRQIIAYHYVTAGRLLLKVSGQTPVPVQRGEIVVLPRNDHHVIGSALNLRPVSAEHLIRPNPDGGLAQIVHGGGGERTHILCGFLGNDMPYNTLIAMLPSVLKLHVADGASGNWIESSFRFAAKELAEGNVKSPAILAKLAELLFMEAVRRYLATQPPDRSAWAAGMHDPIVGRALGLLHGQMTRRWTTEDLAGEIGLSRSAFAERFTRIVGEPPMRYLARQRLVHASMLLRETVDAIARIAYEVGYESEAAFNRAFRREYGVPPAAWRRDDAKR